MSGPRPAGRLLGLLASSLALLAHILPRRLSMAVGRGLGRLWGLLDRRHRRLAVDNLTPAFPDWDSDRREHTARAVYGHFGAILFDVLWLSGRPREAVLGLLDVEGQEHVRAAMAPGRGALLITGHLGNWEVHGVAHGLLFGAIDVVARPIDEPELDARLVSFRTSFGNAVVYKRHALARVMRSLRAGRAVAMLIDQNVREGDGIFVDFLGRRAATTTVAAALALKTGCALLPCRTVLSRGRYRIAYEAPLFADPAAPRTNETERLTRALTGRIEAWVREVPEQWLWIHKRWKTRPPEER